MACMSRRWCSVGRGRVEKEVTQPPLSGVGGEEQTWSFLGAAAGFILIVPVGSCWVSWVGVAEEAPVHPG